MVRMITRQPSGIGGGEESGVGLELVTEMHVEVGKTKDDRPPLKNARVTFYTSARRGYRSGSRN
jgi:hypothetical protein